MAGNVGIMQVREEIWLVTFTQYDLGYFDHETCRLEPNDNPFAPTVLRVFDAGLATNEAARDARIQ